MTQRGSTFHRSTRGKLSRLIYRYPTDLFKHVRCQRTKIFGRRVNQKHTAFLSRRYFLPSTSLVCLILETSSVFNVCQTSVALNDKKDRFEEAAKRNRRSKVHTLDHPKLFIFARSWEKKGGKFNRLSFSEESMETELVSDKFLVCKQSLIDCFDGEEGRGACISIVSPLGRVDQFKSVGIRCPRGDFLAVCDLVPSPTRFLPPFRERAGLTDASRATAL